MAIADDLEKLASDLSDAYDAIEAKGGTMPEHKNTDSLPTAIGSIEGGGVGPSEWGRIWLYKWSRSYEYYSDNCTIVVDWAVFEKYVQEINPPYDEYMDWVTFGWNSDTGLWSSYEFQTPIEDVSDEWLAENMGISVSDIDPEEQGYASFSVGLKKTVIVDFESEPICLELNEELYNSMGTTQDENYEGVIWSDSYNVPSYAIAKFEFGTEPTRTPTGMLSYTGGNVKVDTTYWNITELGDDFLFYCTVTNDTVIPFEDITIVGNKVCNNCHGITHAINFTNAVSIGDAFLYNDWNFDQPVTFGNNLVSIGTGFLGRTKFNRTLTFPESLESIGEGFLRETTAFDQPLVFPSSLQSLGGSLLFSAQKMKSTVDFGDLDTDIIANVSSGLKANILASQYTNFPMFQQGIGIKGTYKQNWLSALPNKTNAFPYRRLYAA